MRAAIKKNIKAAVKQKFGGRCAYCGQIYEKLQVDHLHPVCRAHHLKTDVNDIENLMPACFSCNNYKHGFSLESFRSALEGQVGSARQYSLNFRLAERFGLIQETGKKKIQFYFEEVGSHNGTTKAE